MNKKNMLGFEGTRDVGIEGIYMFFLYYIVVYEYSQLSIPLLLVYILELLLATPATEPLTREYWRIVAAMTRGTC